MISLSFSKARGYLTIVNAAFFSLILNTVDRAAIRLIIWLSSIKSYFLDINLIAFLRGKYIDPVTAIAGVKLTYRIF